MKKIIWNLYVSFILWWSNASLNAIADYSLEYYKLYSKARSLLYTIETHRHDVSKAELSLLIHELGIMIRTMTRYHEDLKRGTDSVPTDYKL